MAAETVGGGELISVSLGSCHCDHGPLLETMAMGVVLLLRDCFNEGIVWMFEVEVGGLVGWGSSRQIRKLRSTSNHNRLWKAAELPRGVQKLGKDER